MLVWGVAYGRFASPRKAAPCQSLQMRSSSHDLSNMQDAPGIQGFAPAGIPKRKTLKPMYAFSRIFRDTAESSITVLSAYADPASSFLAWGLGALATLDPNKLSTKEGLSEKVSKNDARIKGNTTPHQSRSKPTQNPKPKKP